MQKLVATSALGIVSLNKCFSKVQKMAAASTWVGVRSSHSLNASADGSGKIIFLQYLIISCMPAAVVAVVGAGMGAESGEICPGGRTSCRVGSTAAARTRVNCSGEMRPAISVIPLAAFA